MKNVLIALGVLTTVFLVGLLWLNRKGAREKRGETMKAVVWFCVVNGCGWVWCSYLLAYALKSLAENLSKHNNWPDKPAQTEEESNV